MPQIANKPKVRERERGRQIIGQQNQRRGRRGKSWQPSKVKVKFGTAVKCCCCWWLCRCHHQTHRSQAPRLRLRVSVPPTTFTGHWRRWWCPVLRSESRAELSKSDAAEVELSRFGSQKERKRGKSISTRSSEEFIGKLGRAV